MAVARAESRRDGRLRGAAPVGLGVALPELVVDNAEIAERLGVEEGWIERRTGTKTRHVAQCGERLDRLAAQAGSAALDDAGISPADVDVVIVGTTTAEEMSPPAAPLVAQDVGATAAGAIDLNGACVGFVACVATGAALIESGRAETVLAIGADCLHQYLDADDPQSAMLFGDGAGAVVLTAIDGTSHVGPSLLRSDGSERGLITLDHTEQKIRMDGPAVFRHAVRLMADVTTETLEAAGVEARDVDLFVYHQANSRIIDAVGRQLGLDQCKVVDVVARYANTSAASIPIALAAARDDGRLRPGDLVLLAAFGAGLVWGATLVTWDC